jgi:hypothetical protein
LVEYSNDLTATGWTANGLIIDQNETTSPDGQVNASLVYATIDQPAPRIRYTTSQSPNTTYTLSAYGKKATSNILLLRNIALTGGIGGGWFDLNEGVVLATGSYVTSATIEDAGNGWYRCSVTGTTPATIPNNLIDVNPVTSTSDYTVDAGEGVYIYGVQLEAGSTPSSYIPTNGQQVTRAAETLTVPAANLPWPSPVVIGEELVTNGTFDTDSDWTLSANASISAGSLALSGAAFAESVSQDIGYTAGTAVTIAVDVTVVSGIVDIWLGGTASFDYQMIRATSSGSYTVSRASSGADGVLYIRSLQAGTTATIDNISVREINPLSVSIQMQGRMTYADEGDFQQVQLIQWQLDGNNNILHRLRTHSTRTGQFYYAQEAAGVPDEVFSADTYLSPGINVPFNIASRHGSTFVNGAVDGVALTADTTPVALPDLSATDLNLGYDYMGTIKLFRMWAEDLADAGIAPASVDPDFWLYETSTADTGVWADEVNWSY